MMGETLLSMKNVVVGYNLADNGRRYPITIDLEFRVKEGKVELSLTGACRGPHGYGSFGQVYDHIKDDIKKYEWPEAEVDGLIEVWKRWHLNSLNAGCEHQREMKHTMIASGAATVDFFAVANLNTIHSLPGFAKCPKCADGYRYGSAWLHEILPVEVVEYLCDLFEADVNDRNRVLKHVKNEHTNLRILMAVYG